MFVRTLFLLFVAAVTTDISTDSGFAQDRRPTPQAVMAVQDRNGDGAISRQEWQSHRPFGRFDLNGDGSITFIELERVMGARRADETSDIPFGAAPGKKFANVRFLTEQGKPLHLSDLRGKVVLLIPVASWCPPCVASIRNYTSTWQFYRDHPTIRVLIYNYKDSYKSAQSAMRRNGGDVVDFLDAGDTGLREAKGWLNTESGRKFPLPGLMPQHYILDRRGVVLQTMTGSSGNKGMSQMCADVERAAKSLPIQATKNAPLNYKYADWSRC